MVLYIMVHILPMVLVNTTTGDIFTGIALDMDNGKLYVYKNGVILDPNGAGNKSNF
jgi:succinate dehydrogenase/fumarate reductase flavoprotein subunit